LQSLHEQNRVHRNIDLDAVVIPDHGAFYLKKSDEEALDDEVKHLPQIIAGAFVPPERLTGFYTGSFKPDDVYALGCVFYAGAFDAVPAFTPFESAHAKKLMQTPQLLKDTVKLLSLWMIHPDPQERPTIQTVVEKLQAIFPDSLPKLERIAYNGPKIVLDPTDPETCAKIALTLLGTSDGYISRQETKSSYQILGCPLQSKIVLLPKKPERVDEGTFKNGRSSAFLLEKVDGLWRSTKCFALSSRRGRNPESFKYSFQKEIWLYEKLEGTNLFPKHLASFTYAKKPHKRLSLYEPASGCLFEEHPSLFSIKNALTLVEIFKKLHELGLANRDIKSENTLLKQDGSFLLCDIDSLVPDELWSCVRDRVGTPDTMAPERYNKEYSGSWFKDDVYMLGCLFYEKLFRRSLPWSLLEKKANAKYRLTISADNAASLINHETAGMFEATVAEPLKRAQMITYWMLHPDPEKRATMQRVYEEFHKLTNINL
ncbi:MAG: hypothetical protein JSS12_02390, partial [Verrucomicrobia bacterium]|nr:hypothetical protein [Verrucomicrobiota bacterium]